MHLATSPEKAAGVLRQGGLIAYPTEAVWGLGCDPFQRHAVERLLTLKQRPVSKGLILVAGSIQQFDFLLQNLSSEQRKTLQDSWPDAITWLVPHHGLIPEYLCGEHDTIALRVSNHPVIQNLCAAFDGPLVSTSANRSGALPARDIEQLHRYFPHELNAIVAGELGGRQQPSQIIDLLTGQQLR